MISQKMNRTEKYLSHKFSMFFRKPLFSTFDASLIFIIRIFFSVNQVRTYSSIHEASPLRCSLGDSHASPLQCELRSGEPDTVAVYGYDTVDREVTFRLHQLTSLRKTKYKRRHKGTETISSLTFHYIFINSKVVQLYN